MTKTKLTIIEPYGYCKGVKFLLKTLDEALTNNETVYLLEDLIHNDYFSNVLMSKKVVKVNKLEEIPIGSTIVWPGHGHTLKEEQLANKNHLQQIDCTCPYLKNLFERIKNTKENVYFIGNENHREVKTALSFPNVQLFETKSSNLNGVLMNQSTINPTIPLEASEGLKIINTTCPEVLERVKKLKDSLNDNCFAIICGDSKSSNANTLYKEAVEMLGNKKAAIISVANQINDLNISEYKEIVIVSSTSEPNQLFDEIIIKLNNLR